MGLRVGILTDQYPSPRRPDRGTFVKDLVDQLRIVGIEVIVVDRKNPFAMSVECMVRSGAVDIFDAQFVAPAGVVAAFTPRLAPYVLTAHRWDILEFPYRWPMARFAAVAALKRASGIITVSRHIRSHALKLVERDLIEVIPNAVNTNHFRPDSDFAWLRTQIGLGETERVILSVGHLVPRKGFHFLLEAMARVVRVFHDCSLVIVGNGPQLEKLRLMGEQLGLRGKLKLVGMVSDSLLPAFYAMADLFVMSSSSEGHCVAVLEAMSSAKPIVASAIPGNTESVVDGYNGMLVEPGNGNALAGAIFRLLRDDNLRTSLGRNSREKAIKEFDWKIRAARLKRFYELALKRSL